MPGRKVPAAVHGLKVSTCVLAGGAAVAGAAVVGAAVAGVDAVVAGALVAFTAVGDAGVAVAGAAMVVEPAPAGGVRAVVHPDDASVTTRAMTPPVAPMIVSFMMSSYACELTRWR
jgi:hypothetical protein